MLPRSDDPSEPGRRAHLFEVRSYTRCALNGKVASLMLIKMLEMPMAPNAERRCPEYRHDGSYSFQGFNFKGQLPHHYCVRKFLKCSSIL